jgi:hypothetical protein
MAEKAAAKAERGAFWPGELEEAVQQMQRWLAEVKTR